MKLSSTSTLALLVTLCQTALTTAAYKQHAETTKQRVRRGATQRNDIHATHTHLSEIITQRRTTQAQPDSTGFACQYEPLFGTYVCLYGDETVSYPLPDTPSVLAAGCSSYPFAEPTSNNCWCSVFLGTADTLDSPDSYSQQCSSCYFVQSDDETDGIWSLAFDCSNLLTGDCVGKDENGNCIANDGVYADSGFTCEYDPDWGTYVCPYHNGTDSYPIDDPHAALTAYCWSYPFDEPTPNYCYCDIKLGDPNDPNSTQSCSYCYFTQSDDEHDGVWSIAWDCSNILDGDCVGRDDSGNCISHNCAPDGTGPIQVSDDQTEDCQWLADNLYNGYDYLCQFLDVATECPRTCNACSTLPQGTCQDQSGETYIADSYSYRSCSWLSDNMDRFSHACENINVALFCPVTCGKCDVLQ